MSFAHKPMPFSFPSILPREAFGRGVSLKIKNRQLRERGQ